MHLECPHCQARYDITGDVGDALFVCHQCGQEFTPPQTDPCDSADVIPVEAEQAPLRKTAHIWPWLLTMLVVLASVGFWVQKDAWLDNRWLRSRLINIGFDMPLRAKDWRITPASVQPEWITRSGGSKVLLVRGDLKNLLSSAMALPRIQVIFFSKTEPDKQIGASVLEIRQTPSGQQQSYTAALRDGMPVQALAHRRFMIIAQSVPENTGDFMLTPAPDEYD